MRKIARALRSWGFDLPLFFRKAAALLWYTRDYRAFQTQRSKKKDLWPLVLRPVLTDRKEGSGVASGHYFHQDLIVAQKIFKANPRVHLDVGSRVDGFIAHVASFRPIQVLDIRSNFSLIPNIEFVKADLMNSAEIQANVSESISSLHAIEHFGLGRYGDPINIDGHESAIESIFIMLKSGGIFYFSVPIGPQRIEFNAQRVFSLAYLLKVFHQKFNVKSFSYVDDNGMVHREVQLTEDLISMNCSCHYGCGIFELVKI